MTMPNMPNMAALVEQMDRFEVMLAKFVDARKRLIEAGLIEDRPLLWEEDDG